MCFTICITSVTCIVGWTITIITTFSLCFGVIFLFLGLALKFGHTKIFYDFLEEATEKANAALLRVPNILLKKTNAESGIKFSDYDKDVLVGYVSIVFIALGAFLIFSSLFGLFISCAAKVVKKIFKVCLTVIIVVLTLVIIAMLVVARSLVYQNMKVSLESYTGLRDTSLKGMTMNSMMIGLGCCGIKSYEDFQELENWPPKNLDGNLILNSTGVVNMGTSALKFMAVNTSQSFKGCSLVPVDTNTNDTKLTNNTKLTNDTKLSCPWMDAKNFKTPMACCKHLVEISEGCHLNGIANETNNWMNEGCRTKVDEYMSESPYFRFVFPAIIFFMVLLSMMLVWSLIFDGDEKASSKSSNKTTKKSSTKSESTKSESPPAPQRESQRASQMTLSSPV